MNRFRVLGVAVCTAALLSCANGSVPTGSSDELAARAQQLEKKASELRDQERRLASQARDLEQQQRALQSSPGSGRSSTGASAGSDLLPPDPKPGECYARVIVPARYDEETQRVLKREATERIEVIPARYGPAEERVLVKEASTKIEVIPPVYETVKGRVQVSPASTKIVEVPATYKNVSERLLVKPAHTAWKKGTGIGSGKGTASAEQVTAFVSRFGDQKVLETRVEDTGEIMCLVEVPAEYKTVTRRVIATPATTKTVEIPAKYKSVTKQVVKTPARTREVPVPAVYKTLKTTKLIEPARQRSVAVPAKYETVTKRTKVSDERVEWRPVLCEVNMTPRNISQLQTSLKQAGCYRCKVDGIMGRCTLDAMQCYCEPKGLPWGENYVTTQCMKSMGLRF